MHPWDLTQRGSSIWIDKVSIPAHILQQVNGKLVPGHTAGKISIEPVTNFKGAIDMKFLQDVVNNPSNPYMQRNQTIVVHKLVW